MGVEHPPNSALQWPRFELRAPDGRFALADARALIRSGALRGHALLEALACIPGCDRDLWVDEVLGIEQPLPRDIPNLPPGAVPYLPCGVEEIVAMVREVPLRADDELVDLGSGLGRAVLLAHLLTGARAIGVELQEHLAVNARAIADALGLTSVSFVHANAADVELDGSVFFLYAPCNGELLTRVLGRIEAVARRRPIVVCAVGLELRDVGWLRPRPSGFCPSLAVYDSGSSNGV